MVLARRRSRRRSWIPATGGSGWAVCYDIEFPELTRGLALRGRRSDRAAGELAARRGAAQRPADAAARSRATTAYLNRVFVAVCDRVRH